MSEKQKKSLNKRSTELRRHRIARRTEEEKEGRKKWAEEQRNRPRKHKCPHSTCKWSEISFKANPKLLRHIKAQHADAAETIHCKLCGETFKEKYNLTAHLKHKHIEDEAYPCDQCDRVFKWKNSLTEHKRLHTGEAFKCEHPGCGLVTAFKQHYKKHMRAHEGKPFKCEECGEAYMYSDCLRRHTMVEHSSDAQRFYCDLCNYSTLRQDGLKEHRQKCAKAKQTGIRGRNLGRPLRRNRSTLEERPKGNDDEWLEMETTEVDDTPGSIKASRIEARAMVLRSSTRRRNAAARSREPIKVDPDALVADILSVKAEVKDQPVDVE
ncbi:zinc finger protein [Aphelenchoides avenae]|nr:zinc finger protein [Aphelenchus avenae]